MSDLQISSGDSGVYLDGRDTAICPKGHPPLSVRSFGLTDAGKVRATNQDQFLVAVLLKSLQVEHTSLPQRKVRQSPDRSHLFVVADGMGGHAGGEQASAMAIDSVETFILGTFKWFAELKEPGQDQVLLCSDGLTGMLTDDEINKILHTEVEPEEACRQLVARANEAGGRDNITAVVADFCIAASPALRAMKDQCEPSTESQKGGRLG